jgi:hypothetical protein
LIARLKSGSVPTEQLEISLGSLRAVKNASELVRHLSPEDIPEFITRAFWAIAKQSLDYEAVKWGIAIGALSLREDMIPDLLTFARHTEFTPFAVDAILRACNKQPEWRSYLVPLLAVSEGWGTVRLVNAISREKQLTQNLDVIRAVTIYGVENSEALLVEIGHTIGGMLKPDIFELARNDSRLFVSIVLLMEEILTMAPSLGGILDIPEPKIATDEYFRLLASRSADIWLLKGMRTAKHFFDDPACPFADRAEKSASLALMLKERMSESIVRRGLVDEKARWIALQIIDQERMLELLPELERMAIERPKGDILRVLRMHGDSRQLQSLLELLPRVVDPTERAKRPFSRTNVIWPEKDEAEWEYAVLVMTMGAVASKESIRMLKAAMSDFNPSCATPPVKAQAKFLERKWTTS